MEGSKEQVELLMMYEEIKNERDQYKTAHNKLTAGLKEAVAESIKYKRERDSLIKDVEKLREEVKSLNRETTKYFEHWQEIFGKDREYREAWNALKDTMLEEYPSVDHEADVSNGDAERGVLSTYEKVLKQMDQLDGTHDFENVLHVLKRRSK
ncbi:hypothetical protein PYH58_11965 [Mammaliicoccus sciuri]|uniref:hypothetical protein n=1 Tax=Mammaliicoccus sciuri TaxID=1296 RepID=UPI0033651C36